MLAIGFLALVPLVTTRHAGSLLLSPILRTSGDTRIIAHMFQRSKRMIRREKRREPEAKGISGPLLFSLEELDLHHDRQDHRTAMRLFIEKLTQGVFDLVFDEGPV